MVSICNIDRAPRKDSTIFPAALCFIMTPYVQNSHRTDKFYGFFNVLGGFPLMGFSIGFRRKMIGCPPRRELPFYGFQYRF